MATHTIPHCPICGQDVHSYVQPALHSKAVPREYGECLNPRCRAYGITLHIDKVLALTLEIAETFPDLRPAVRV